MSGEREQASEHHSKQAGRFWDRKVSFHWVRVALKASFEKAAKSHGESAMVEVLAGGRAEARAVVRKKRVARS